MIITHTCDNCNGTGAIETDVCISEWTAPSPHDREDDIGRIITDAIRSKSDHRRLCEMNPRAVKSYDRQLAETLGKLEASAKSLL